MDTNAQAILVGAISAGFVAVLTIVGKLVFDNRSSNSTAKQSDLKRIEEGYAKLQATYENAIAGLTNQLGEERLARRADKLECQTRIDGLQRQLTTLLTRLPEPGAVMPVVIAGIDTAVIPALPVVIKGPLPIPMTAAQVQAKAAAEAEGLTVEESTNV